MSSASAGFPEGLLTHTYKANQAQPAGIAKETLTPADAVLEVGPRTVRLGSLSAAWMDLEADCGMSINRLSGVCILAGAASFRSPIRRATCRLLEASFTEIRGMLHV